MNYKLSKSDWEKIGLKAGWLKKAQPDWDRPEYPQGDNGPDEPSEDFKGLEDYRGSWEDIEDSEMESDFSYLIEGHEDDSKMKALFDAATRLSGMMDDSSDVHAALYWLLANYHGGQSSPEYAALSASPYSPGRMENGPTGEAKEIYEELKAVYEKKK